MSLINLPITKHEILKCVRKLKNEKASGEDEIINEYIKRTVTSLLMFMKNYLMLYLIMVLCLAVG